MIDRGVRSGRSLRSWMSSVGRGVLVNGSAGRIGPLLLTLATASCATDPAVRPVAGAVNPDGALLDVRVEFIAEAEEFASAAREYQKIWSREGHEIVAAMEEISRLSFTRPSYADTAIAARVLERPSFSGYREQPMVLRASYGPDTKRATLIHELGHRLQSDLFRKDEPQHGALFLWIYDVWVDLYGRDFAAEQVVIEKARGERYARAWNRVLAMSRFERARAWEAILSSESVR